MKIKLRELCQRNNISLYKLAQMLDKPYQTIYSWANNRTQPSFLNMEKLCSVLNCEISDILEPELVREVCEE